MALRGSAAACLLLALSFGGFSEAGKILMIPSPVVPSHKMVMMSLAEEMIQRGHEVTIWQVVMKPDSVPVPKGAKERLWVVETPEKYINNMFLYENSTIYDLIWDTTVTETARRAGNWAMMLRLCERVLETRKADFDALVKEHFDVVVLDDLFNPCGLFQVALKKTIFVYWSMTLMRSETAWANHSPSPPSYIPVSGTGYTDDMDFWQRSFNLLSYIKTIYIHHRIVLRSMDDVFAKFFPGTTSSFLVERNASLNFINSPSVFDFPRPYMPRVIFVGGLHCRKPQALEGPLAEFVGKADKGFVLFTTGFTVDWKKAPKTILQVFLDTFKASNHLSFVWQYNGPRIEGLPSNVYVDKWLPQQDLLGHPNCKAFITVGGLNSLVEAMYHGVPVVAVPLFYEHLDYSLRVTTRKAGVIIDKSQLSKESLSKALRKTTGNDQLRANAQLFSQLIRDTPYTEMEHAAFWLEFIIRHQEVPHARSGADHLNIFQYFLIDVIAFLLACSILVAVVLWTILKYSFKVTIWCCSKAWRLIRPQSKQEAKVGKKKEE